jgi:8-oxo-dGTP pyrophosphatase MutT (NUDIX family)
MVHFHQGISRFNLRSSCVCKRGDEILLFHFDIGDFWSLPGGRSNLHESTSDTAIREFQEEIGEKVKVDRLLWVIENFFKFEEENFHELLFVYLVELPTTSKIINENEFFAHEGEKEMLCRFVNPKDFSKYNILPNILSRLLSDIPSNTEHIIHHG